MVSNDGKTIYCWGKLNEVETIKWHSEEDLKNLSKDREPLEAPLCHYKIQPENQGKLIWLLGPPGSGKSVTCQLLSRECGYVYFEADAISSFVNPFVPTNVENPTMATYKQKPLKV